jgi:prephenate dehydrogenase
MPLTTTAILGTGLLGGSLALALREKRNLILYTRSKETAKKIKQAGFNITTDPHNAVQQAQEIVFCIPAAATAEVAKKIRPSVAKGAFITDVVSTKANIVRVLQPMFAGHAYFIGSHPMAGGEKNGFSAARADLFDKANVILTPTAKTSPKAINWAKKFWKSLNTHIHILTPTQHDHIVAQISHLPHLLAACLVTITPAAAMLLSGPGYRDTTRIASSSPEMWTEIFLDNHLATIRAAKAFIANLKKTLTLLNKKDYTKLYGYLLFASQKRIALLSRHCKAP